MLQENPKLNKRIQFAVSGEMRTAALRKAWEQHIDLSEALRQLVQMWLDGEVEVKPPPPPGEEG